jgi:hypothetical protein
VVIRIRVHALGGGLPAYWAWTVRRPFAVLAGWYVGRRFVSDFLDV